MSKRYYGKRFVKRRSSSIKPKPRRVTPKPRMGGVRKYVRRAGRYARYVKRGARTVAKYGNDAEKALDLAEKIAGLMNIERKYNDVTTTLTNVTTSGSIFSLTSIAQGSGQSERIGDSIKLQGLTFRWWWAYGASNVVARVIVFIDKEGQIGTNVGSLLAAAGTIYGVTSPKNWEQSQDSKILYDTTIHSVDADDHYGRVHFKHIKLRRHVKYQAGTSNEISGALKVCVITSELSNSGTFRATARLTYTDD